MEQTQIKKRRRRRGRWIILICLAVLAAILLGLAFWQRNNIQAVVHFTKYSQEELEQKLQDNDKTIQQAVESAPEVNIRAVTEEERQALRDGAITQEELVERLLQPDGGDTPAGGTGDTSAAPSQPENQGEGPPSDAASSAQQAKPTGPGGNSDYEKQLSALIAKVYVLREEYLIALDNMQAAATADYKAIPSEQRSGSAVASLVSDYLAQASALEKECDGRMDAIITQLEKLLKENGGDMSLADTVFNTYVEEKSLKKAWYMAELKKRGLI